MLILLAFAFALGSGCNSEPSIEVHKIPKSRSGLEKLREKKQVSTDPSQPRQKTTRMAVAIFDNPDATWFVKVVGPIAQVDATEPQWQAFFQALKFEDGKPTWTLPEGWSVAGPKPMRFETLVIGDTQPPLEVAISDLGPNQDLLLNVNRWRVSQLGLPPAAQSDLDEMLKKQTSEVGEFLVFDTTGFGSGQMSPPFASGAAPFAGGLAPFAGGAASAPDVSSNAAPGKANNSDKDLASPQDELSFEIPEGLDVGRDQFNCACTFEKNRRRSNCPNHDY